MECIVAAVSISGYIGIRRPLVNVFARLSRSFARWHAKFCANDGEGEAMRRMLVMRYRVAGTLGSLLMGREVDSATDRRTFFTEESRVNPMSSYFRRHVTLGSIAMAALLVMGVARHVALSYFAVLAIVGVLQGVVVMMLGRRLPD